MSEPSALVLLHGALGSTSQLEPLAAVLRPHFDVHLLDFEGHGSRPTNRAFRMSTFAENVVELLDRERITSARFFGYSMGGYVALTLASRMPERVTSIATLGTKFRWDPKIAARETIRLNPDVIRAKVPPFAEALQARHAAAGGWENVLAKTAELLRDLGDHPVLTDATLSRVTRPVRVIVGDRDNTVSVEESRGAANALGNGTLSVMENTPHPIEQVDVAKLAELLR
jgi:pimeloyl-ACP methyl ester carboxylesterase